MSKKIAFLLFYIVLTSTTVLGQKPSKKEQQGILVTSSNKKQLIKEHKKIWITTTDSVLLKGRVSIFSDSTIKINEKIIDISSIEQIKFYRSYKQIIGSSIIAFESVQMGIGIKRLNEYSGSTSTYDIISPFLSLLEIIRIGGATIIIGGSTFFFLKNKYYMKDGVSISIKNEQQDYFVPRDN